MTRQVWTLEDVRSWFSGRVPGPWFVDLHVVADREEILVVGELETPACEPHDDTTHRLQCTARIQQFRDDTRDDRMSIADEAELLWGRKVSWGVACGGFEEFFTILSVPVMTRLRMGERSVLDTLIDAGVARTRSEALAWCVRLVGQHEDDWLDELRGRHGSRRAGARTGPRRLISRRRCHRVGRSCGSFSSARAGRKPASSASSAA